MAIVDLNTNDIIGAKQGSLTWWHEYGHIIYNRNLKNKILDWWGDSFFKIAVASIIIKQIVTNEFLIDVLTMSSISALVIWFLIYQYEEIWCWAFAFKNRKKT